MESSRAKKLIDEYLTYEEAKQLLVKLVQFPSPQTALLEKEPQVLALIQQTIRPELEKDGIRPIIDDKGNLIATLKGEEDQGKSLLLVSYAMNAAPATMQNPYSGEIVDGTPYQIEGECVWGRGACEQKGSLAAMMLAIKIIARCQAKLPADLIFATSTAGETGRHLSVSHILNHNKIKTDWGILDGPPQIQLGNKGRIDILVTVKGKPTHSSRPWDGINAIQGAVKVLEKLDPLMPYPSERAHPKLGQVSLTPTSIQSFPKATHTVPAECQILLDRRLLPGDDPNEAVEDLKTAIGEIDPYEVKIRGEDFSYPSEVTKDAEIVSALEQSIRTMLGREPEYTFASAALDAGLLNREGIQSVSYGPRDFRFQHTDNELVSITNVFETAKVFAHIALSRG